MLRLRLSQRHWPQFIERKIDHRKALETFARDCEERENGDVRVYKGTIPHIAKMVEFKLLAQYIRKERESEELQNKVNAACMTLLPKFEDVLSPAPPQPILVARKKESPDKTTYGKADIEEILEDLQRNPPVDNVNVVNKEPINTKINSIDTDACKAIAVAIEREKRVIEVLSAPQKEAAMEKIHVEILAEKEYKPLEIVTMMYPDASEQILREKAKWVSNHINSLKKPK